MTLVVLQIQEELIDPVSGYAIDFVIVAKGSGQRPVAVEVNGPTHYLFCMSAKRKRMPRGKTTLKARHLSQLGYAVVSVPYWEWPSVGTAGQAYLERAVSSALARSCGAVPSDSVPQ
jgi:RAP domain